MATTLSPTDALTGALAASPELFAAVVMLLKLTLVLGAALATTRAMPRASAGARHLVWLAALAALLLLPPLAVWSPLPVRVLPAAGFASSGSAEAVPEVAPPSATPLGAGPAAAPSAVRDAASPRLSVGAMLVLLWAAGALALLGRLAYGAWSVRRIVRRARRLEQPDWQAPLFEIADRLGLAAAPQLLQSDEVKMPFAAGLWTARIVLPAESEGWTPARRSAVLIHELGHVRRRDLVGHTLSRVACALYWFHPLVWTAARQLRAESERACDDLALVFGARPSEYAEHLLEIVSCVRDHRTPAVALAMAHRREFEGRMLAILNPELQRRGPGRWATLSLAGSVAGLALLVGAAAPAPRRAPVPAAGVTAQPPATPGDTGLRVELGRTRSGRVEPRAAPRPVPRPDSRPAPDPQPRPDPAPGGEGAAVATADDERATVLARTLQTDKSGEVRRVAAWGLQRYARLEVAVDALTAALARDPDEAVREMAAWALASARRSPAAAAALAGAIRGARSPRTRATAVWSAGSVREASTVEALTGALGDADAAVREVAAWAIGSCGPERAPAALLRGLGDPDRNVRLSTAWALYAIHDAGSIGAIDAAFQKETDPEVQEGLLRALGAMGEASVEVLQRMVTSTDSAVRVVAITALAGGGAGGPWPWPRPMPRPFP